MSSPVEGLYPKLPSAMQQVALEAVAWRNERDRYGEPYPRLLAEYEERSHWSHEEVIGFQQRRLADLMRHAATTPFWGKELAQRGLSPEAACRPEAFNELPLVTKEQMQASIQDFIPRPAGTSLRWAHTSGTTGAGLRFRVNRRFQQEQWSVWWRYRRWHQICRGEWCAYFGGRAIVPLGRRNPPYWRVSHPARQVLFSNYHLNTGGLKEVVAELRRRRLAWIHGYPSSIALVAQHLLDDNDTLGYPLRWVTVGAESLQPAQFKAITAAFGIAPLQHYGCAEGVVNASECEAGSKHLDEDFSLAQPSPDGQIIGTALANTATIFMRYITADTAAWSAERCACGRPGRLLSSIDGRIEDYLELSDGRKVGRIDHVFKDLTHVLEAQVSQRDPGRATVRIVPSKQWGSSDEARVDGAFRDWFGDKLEVQTVLVSSIARTTAGKLRLVVRDADP